MFDALRPEIRCNSKAKPLARTLGQMIENTEPNECFDDCLPDGWTLRVTLDYEPDGQITGRLVIYLGTAEKSIQVMTRLGASAADAQALMRQRARRWIDEYCSTRSVAGGGTG